MRIGAHISISGGIAKALERASETGCECMQFFISNPRAWAIPQITDSEITEFNLLRKKYDIYPLVIHSPYLPNIASPDKHIYQKSIKILKANIDIAEKINADYFIIHPGNYLFDDLQKSIKRVADAVNILNSNSKNIVILIENTAGQGSEVGFLFSQLGQILQKIKNKKRCGVCIDTAHLFAAGYDFTDEIKLKNTITEMSAFFEISNVKLFHFNDTLVQCGVQRDRHHYIGEGLIGIDSFKNIMNHSLFNKLAAIIETPEKLDPGHLNAISTIKKIR